MNIKIKQMYDLSKLLVSMVENGATEQEILNVGEFQTAVTLTRVIYENIYEIDILKEYKDKYCK